jgi:S1-C subfamily serine protease
MPDLMEWSDALRERADAARALVVAVRVAGGVHISGTAWDADAVVTSDQSLPRREAFAVVLPSGDVSDARVVGRDPGTNVALLRLAHAGPAPQWRRSEASAGALALAFGADGSGGVSVRMGVVNRAGPEWVSNAGGRIDRRIVLDLHLSRTEEGGPACDAAGACLGIPPFGPRGQVLVIPSATVDRVLPALVRSGRVARGWLGVALQPVAVPDGLRGDAGEPGGLMVMSMAEGGPAARAGLLAGDILVSIDGVPTARPRDHARQLGPDSVGRNADLRVIRGGAVMSLSAAIEARPGR